MVADQSPTALAPAIIRNTNLKIGLRLLNLEDRHAMTGLWASMSKSQWCSLRCRPGTPWFSRAMTIGLCWCGWTASQSASQPSPRGIAATLHCRAGRDAVAEIADLTASSRRLCEAGHCPQARVHGKRARPAATLVSLLSRYAEPAEDLERFGRRVRAWPRAGDLLESLENAGAGYLRELAEYDAALAMLIRHFLGEGTDAEFERALSRFQKHTWVICIGDR